MLLFGVKIFQIASFSLYQIEIGRVPKILTAQIPTYFPNHILQDQAGKACMAFHDTNVRDIKAKLAQVDEIWSFTYAKQKNVAALKPHQMARAIL